MIITGNYLHYMNACYYYWAKFESDFPYGLEVKPESWVLLLQEGYDPVLDWLYTETGDPIYKPTFDGLELVDMHIQDAMLSNWNIEGTVFKDCTFVHCDLYGAEGATFETCVFIDCDEGENNSEFIQCTYAGDNIAD